MAICEYRRIQAAVTSPQSRAVMKRCCISNRAVSVLLHMQQHVHAQFDFNPITTDYYALARLLLGLFFYI